MIRVVCRHNSSTFPGQSVEMDFLGRLQCSAQLDLFYGPRYSRMNKSHGVAKGTQWSRVIKLQCFYCEPGARHRPDEWIRGWRREWIPSPLNHFWNSFRDITGKFQIPRIQDSWQRDFRSNTLLFNLMMSFQNLSIVPPPIMTRMDDQFVAVD